MNEMRFETQNGRHYLVMSCSEEGANIDTQIQMLVHNQMPEFLQSKVISKNGENVLKYDITSLSSLKKIIERERLNKDQFIKLLKSLLRTLTVCEEYLLFPSGICLDPEYIYMDLGSFTPRFVYLPTLNRKSQEVIIQDFVREFISKAYISLDKEGVINAILHTINQPHFTLDTLLGQLNDNRAYPPSNQGVQKPQYVERVEEVKPAISPQSTLPPVMKPPVQQTTVQQTKVVKELPMKNKVIVGIIQVIAIAAAVGANLTPIVMVDGELDISKVLGIIILIGAVDFLIIRNLLDEKNKVEVTKMVNNNSPVSTMPKQVPNISNVASVPSMPGVPNRSNVPNIPNIPNIPSAPHVPSIPNVSQQAYQERQASYSAAGSTVLLEEEEEYTDFYLQTAKGHTISLTTANFRLGREQTMVDYVCDEPTVGRFHAEIIKKENKLYIQDNNSTNGTYVNDERIPSNHLIEIKEGDGVKLGKMLFTVRGK